jgi:hypothetical protein
MTRSLIIYLLILVCLHTGFVAAMENSSTDSPVNENKKSVLSYLSEKLHSLEKINWPECCISNTTSITQLITHIQNEHRSKKDFLCTCCNTLYASAKRAASCLIKHNNKRFFGCPLCKSTHTRFENLMNHCKNKCRFNDQFEKEVFRSGKRTGKNSQQHVHSHKESAIDLVNNRIARASFTCCNQPLQSFDELSAHLYIYHKKDEAIICPGCSKTHNNADKAACCVLYTSNNTIFASEDGTKKCKTLRALTSYIKKTMSLSTPNQIDLPLYSEVFPVQPSEDFPLETVELATYSHPTDRVIERVFGSPKNRFL